MTSIPSGSTSQSFEADSRQNPYSKILNDVNLATFPEYTGLVRKVLTVFGCIHGITVIICISVLLIPIRRGPEARKKLTWLLRRQYVASTSTPYHVMNSSLVVVISQLLSSLVFVTYILIDYWSLNSKCFILRAYLHVCWEVCLLPAYFGFHVTAFSSLYTCLCSPRHTAKRRSFFTHPLFLNLLFYASPIVVTIQTIGWSVVLALAVIAQERAYNALVAYLEYAADTWIQGQNLNNPIHRQTMYLLADYARKSNHFTIFWIWSSRTWSTIGLALAVFYAINVAGLLNLLRNCLKVLRDPIQFDVNFRPVPVPKLSVRESLELRAPCDTPPDVFLDRPAQPSPTIQVQTSFKGLKNGYIYLIVHCSIMLLSLLIHVICSLIRTTQTEKAVVDKRWRSKTTWLVLLGSTLASLAMLFHSWRVLTERDDTQIQGSSSTTRFRNLLISSRDSPHSGAKSYGSELEQQCRKTDQNEFCIENENGGSPSSYLTDVLTINPVRSFNSPMPFSEFDEMDNYKSFKSPMRPTDFRA